MFEMAIGVALGATLTFCMFLLIQERNVFDAQLKAFRSSHEIAESFSRAQIDVTDRMLAAVEAVQTRSIEATNRILEALAESQTKSIEALSKAVADLNTDTGSGVYVTGKDGVMKSYEEVLKERALAADSDDAADDEENAESNDIDDDNEFGKAVMV